MCLYSYHSNDYFLIEYSIKGLFMLIKTTPGCSHGGRCQKPNPTIFSQELSVGECYCGVHFAYM